MSQTNKPVKTQEDSVSLAHAAVRAYMDEDCTFSVATISDIAGVSEETFFEHFPNKTAALHYFYTTIPLKYLAMVEDLEGYDELSAGEKLANYIFSVFDMLQEERDFVEETFDSYVFKAWMASDFEKESRRLINEFLENDPGIPPLNKMILQLPADRVLTYELLHVLKFWLADTSYQSEKSAELVEKMTAFVDEILYTAVADRGFDLAKFMLSHGAFSSRIPLLGRFLP